MAGVIRFFSGFTESCFRDVTALVTKYAQQPVAPATNLTAMPPILRLEIWAIQGQTAVLISYLTPAGLW